MLGKANSYKGKMVKEEVVGDCVRCEGGIVLLTIFEKKKLRKRNKEGEPLKETRIRRKECQCQNEKCGWWYHPNFFLNQKAFVRLL